MDGGRVVSYFIDACLIAGILASGLYLARHGEDRELLAPSLRGDSASEEDELFTSAPPIPEGGHPTRTLGGAFGNIPKVSVDVSYSGDVPLQPEDGNAILNAFPQVS